MTEVGPSRFFTCSRSWSRKQKRLWTIRLRAFLPPLPSIRFQCSQALHRTRCFFLPCNVFILSTPKRVLPAKFSKPFLWQRSERTQQGMGSGEGEPYRIKVSWSSPFHSSSQYNRKKSQKKDQGFCREQASYAPFPDGLASASSVSDELFDCPLNRTSFSALQTERDPES